ncbi:uncharacterized protein LOC111821321 [Trichechus manatus latirostris]|uniref:Uncharacterized protein LOC111821321 n=1 Tax=Trichechus manatus latirostris TaxID=127582 RepID=A0A2Y9RC29_TRIMA|nr:uncharacterized protein LOC111821321 [Trichechus manatus latirostris]
MDRMASSMKQVPNPLPKVLSRRGVGAGLEAAERESFERTQYPTMRSCDGPTQLWATEAIWNGFTSFLMAPGSSWSSFLAHPMAQPLPQSPSPTRPQVCPPLKHHLMYPTHHKQWL